MQFRQIPVVFARSPNHFPKVTTLLFVCSAVSFVNDKGQRDTYQYVKSGNGQIAHINGIMSELIYLSDIRQKIISAKKIESLTLQSVTVRCGERSATFFIDPALTSDECLQVEQMLTSPSVRIPYGSDVALYDTDFDALIPIIITDFTSELSDTNEKLNSVKFTWRFAENRPKVAVPESPGIFNEKYNPTFS